MGLSAIKLLVSRNRGRVQVQIGQCHAELTPEEVHQLQLLLHRAASQVSYTAFDPAVRGEQCDGHALMDPVAGKRLTERLFEMLTVAARLGAPCPTNSEIADRLGLTKPEIAVDLMKLLEQRGRITVERFQRSRVVTIVESGLATERPLVLPEPYRERRGCERRAEVA